jgi:Tol biopolymer transport system component
MNADGSDPVRLTDNAASDDGPVWSPDGSKIAFTSNRDGNGEIYVMNADGSVQTDLTNAPSEDVNADWSPDSSKLVFWSDRGGSRDIFVMNAADGSAQTDLTNNPSDDAAPVWSPEGGRIAFESDRAGNTEIYVMGADGSNVVRVTSDAHVDKDPVWDPVPTPSVSDTRVKEGETAKFSVEIPEPLNYLVSFDFQTEKATARPNKDFKPLNGTLVFPPGDTKASIRIRTINDHADEGKERFYVNVPLGCRCGNPTGGATIIDND